MERLISLFREADYDQWSPSDMRDTQADEDCPAGAEEPLYFRQLLAYLHEQRRREKGADAELSSQEFDAEELVGAGA